MNTNDTYRKSSLEILEELNNHYTQTGDAGTGEKIVSMLQGVNFDNVIIKDANEREIWWLFLTRHRFSRADEGIFPAMFSTSILFSCSSIFLLNRQEYIAIAVVYTIIVFILYRLFKTLKRRKQVKEKYFGPYYQLEKQAHTDKEQKIQDAFNSQFVLKASV